MRKALCIALVIAIMLPSFALAYEWQPFISSRGTEELLELHEEIEKYLALSGEMAFISPNGKKYHYYSDCNNIQHHIFISVKDAKECGYMECKICDKRRRR